MGYKIKKFQSSNGCEILVGQDDLSNDHLTFKVGKPNDIWMHVSGVPGSHVVLKCENVDRLCLDDAAGLAAWYSKMRGGGKVAVNYCFVKNVNKPRGAKPGSVRISREKKIKARPKLLEEI